MPTFFEIIAETLDRAYEDLSEDEHPVAERSKPQK